MRLIDADEFISRLNNYIDKPITAGLCATLIHLFPTAYDIDKVVEELKKLKQYKLNIGDAVCDIQANGINRHFICLEDAIKIVGQEER